MPKEILKTKDIAASPSPFNHVIRAGNILYLTSQLSCDLKTGKFIYGDIAIQTKNTLNNIEYLLNNSGSSIGNIINIVIYIKDLDNIYIVCKILYDFFKEQQKPTTAIISAVSPIKGIDIEIEANALINE